MRPLNRSIARVPLGVAMVLLVPLLAMQFSNDVVWSLPDFVAAGALLAVIGSAFELAVKKAGSLPLAGALAALGLAAVLFGNADDAPGLVLLGIALVAGACAIGVRRV
jgi:hypothetical protein